MRVLFRTGQGRPSFEALERRLSLSGVTEAALVQMFGVNFGGAGQVDLQYDLDGDGDVDADDVALLIHDQLNTEVGDLNFDGVIDVTDFQMMRSGFGTGGSYAEGDLNGDGRVDLTDMQIMRANFGYQAADAPPADGGSGDGGASGTGDGTDGGSSGGASEADGSSGSGGGAPGSGGGSSDADWPGPPGGTDGGSDTDGGSSVGGGSAVDSASDSGGDSDPGAGSVFGASGAPPAAASPSLGRNGLLWSVLFDGGAIGLSGQGGAGVGGSGVSTGGIGRHSTALLGSDIYATFSDNNDPQQWGPAGAAEPDGSPLDDAPPPGGADGGRADALAAAADAGPSGAGPGDGAGSAPVPTFAMDNAEETAPLVDDPGADPADRWLGLYASVSQNDRVDFLVVADIISADGIDLANLDETFALTDVPEPLTIALLGLGAAAPLARRCRDRRRTRRPVFRAGCS